MMVNKISERLSYNEFQVWTRRNVGFPERRYRNSSQWMSPFLVSEKNETGKSTVFLVQMRCVESFKTPFRRKVIKNIARYPNRFFNRNKVPNHKRDHHNQCLGSIVLRPYSSICRAIKSVHIAFQIHFDIRTSPHRPARPRVTLSSCSAETTRSSMGMSAHKGQARRTGRRTRCEMILRIPALSLIRNAQT